ncbi:hypothetical protein [Microbacterium sp.]|uniref:hypothetical protein n=1 Tax=Microbacterium sp. TaxID=51671 RepID=UPI003F98842F
MSEKQDSEKNTPLWRRKAVWIPTIAVATALCVGGGYLVVQDVQHRQEVAAATSAYTDAAAEHESAIASQQDAADELAAVEERAAKVYAVLHRISEGKLKGYHLAEDKTLEAVRTAAAELAETAQLELTEKKALAEEQTPAVSLSEPASTPAAVTLADDVAEIEAETADLTSETSTVTETAEQLTSDARAIDDAIALADTRVDELMASAAKKGGDATVDKASKKKRKALSAAVKELTSDDVADLTFTDRAKRLEAYVKAYASARKDHKKEVAAEKEAAQREAAQRNANSGGSGWGGGSGSSGGTGGGGSSSGGGGGSSSGGGGSNGGSGSSGGGGSSSGGGGGGSNGGGGGGGEPTGPAPLTVNGAAQGTSGECAVYGSASTTGGTMNAPGGTTNYTASWDGSRWQITWYVCGF